MTDQPTNISLRLALEQAALQQSTTGVDAIRAKFAALKAEAQATGRVADGALGDVASGAKDGVDAVKELDGALGKTSKTLGELQKSAAKGFNVEGLRRTGGALSQLGLGDLGRPVQLLGDIGQIGKEVGLLAASLGGLLPVIAGAAVVFGVLGKIVIDGMDTVKLATTQLSLYYKTIQDGTTESIKLQIAKAKADKESADAEIKTLEAAKLAAAGPSTPISGVGDRNRPRGNRDTRPAALLFDLSDAGKRLSELQGQSKTLTATIETLNRALDSGKVASNDFLESLKKFPNVAEKATSAWEAFMAAGKKLAEKQATDQIAALDDQIRAEDKYRNLSKTMTTQQLEDQLEADDQLMRQNRLLIDSLQGLDDPSGKIAEKIKQLTEQNDKLAASDQKLVSITRPLIEAREKEGQIAERDKRLADVQAKHEDEVARIEQQALERRADIQQKYNDKLVDIARQAAEDAAAELRKLQQQQADLATSFARDNAKIDQDAANQALNIQIKAARDEEQAAREHAREIKQIQDDARARELGFLLDRNFLGLLQSRIQTTADIGRSNTQFSAQQQEKKIAEQNELTDLQRSIAQQRAARQLAYQQQLADAQRDYQRALQQEQIKREQELRLANEARQRDLRDLSAKTANELRIKDSAYKAEIRLANLYGAALVQVEDNMQRARLSRANAALAAMGAAGHEMSTRRAEGGPLSAGQISSVNEPGFGGESFNGVKFPNLPGIFIPTQAGNVTPGKGSGGVTFIQTNHITGPDPKTIGDMIDHRTMTLLENVLQ